MKKFLFTGILTIATLIANGASITPEEALTRLDKSRNGMTRSGVSQPELKLTLPAVNGEAALYVFDYAPGQGYVIASAEDAVIPLLGYSDTGTFDPENIPAPLQNWLQEYVKQISFIKSSNIVFPEYKETEKSGLPSDWKKIEPLVKTQWNQHAPYNLLCPLYGGINCYTGCVATSMAQVMKYYEYPAIGKGTISYQCSSLNNRTLTLDLSATPFDWDNMLDIYLEGNYNSDQATAVAYLMQAAGYSVNMHYTTDVSGAYSPDIAGAMIEYFGYDEGMNYVDRSNYSYDEWAKMIYDNIASGMPVIYDGNNAKSDGHSFICDGYDGDGMFHFNWGWGGASDGYYTLDLLNPSSIGIGGAGGGFNFLQDALLGIQPSTGETEQPPFTYQQYGALFVNRINNNNMYLGVQGGYPYSGWGYYGVGEIVMKIGVIAENTETGETQILECANSSNFDTPLPSGGIFAYDSNVSQSSPRVNLKNLNLESGVVYKITIAACNGLAEEEEWIPFTAFYGFPNYVLLTYKGTQGYEWQNMGVVNYEASDIELLTDLYYGSPVKIKATITNNSDIQQSNGVNVMLLDSNGVQKYMSDGFILTLDAGETIDYEWIAQLNRLENGTDPNTSQEYQLILYNLETGLSYEMDKEYTVTMQPNPGVPVISTSLDALNAKEENGKFVISDPSAIDLKLDLNLISGYFGYPVVFNILYEPVKGTGNLYNLLQQNYEDIPFLTEESPDAVLETTMNFPNPNIGETYYFFARYYRNNEYVNMDQATTLKPFIVAESGVESVEVAGLKTYYDRVGQSLKLFGITSDCNVLICNIEGKTLKNVSLHGSEYSEIDLKDVTPGVLIIRISDNSGCLKTLKIAR